MLTFSSREGLACAAGFFNGEGHVGSSVGKIKKWVRRDLYLSISQTDRWVLDRFRYAVGGLGRISGPFVRSYRNPSEHDVYYYQLNRFEHVQAVVAMLWAWLSPVKKTQAAAALIAMRERSSHRRDYPCGHPRTAENTRASGRKIVRRSCLTCNREKMQYVRLVRKTARAMLAA